MIDAFSQLTEIKTPDSLTGKELGQLRKLAAKGRLTKAYDKLAERGYQYAMLANGVVKGDTFAGRIALEYLEEIADKSKQRHFSRRSMAISFCRVCQPRIHCRRLDIAFAFFCHDTEGARFILDGHLK